MAVLEAAAARTGNVTAKRFWENLDDRRHDRVAAQQLGCPSEDLVAWRSRA